MRSAANAVSEHRKRLGRCEAVAVLCGAVAERSWWIERARRARVHVVASAAPIRANGVSEDMSLSDRERVEGFQPSGRVAVAITASERVEGFQPSGRVAVAITASERVEGFTQYCE